MICYNEENITFGVKVMNNAYYSGHFYEKQAISIQIKI